MTEPLLETVEIATGDPAELAVIWLHGLGADGHDFEPIVPELGLRVRRALRVPARADPARHDQQRHADARLVRHLGFRRRRRGRAGIRASAAAVTRLVDREIERGVPANRIVLAGFSQGGAIALQLALRSARRLAGVLALSTYLPLAGSLAAREERRERRLADLHGARQRRSGDSARARRGIAAPARGGRVRASIGTSIRWRTRCAFPRSRRSGSGSRDSRDPERQAPARRVGEFLSARSRPRSVSRTSPVSRPARVERSLGERDARRRDRRARRSTSACRRSRRR